MAYAACDIDLRRETGPEVGSNFADLDWRLPAASSERPHGLKYSLFYGRPAERIVCYDNEAGKGDHRHYGDREEPYAFTTVDKLISDFEADVLHEERAAESR
ncbi:toxin-antitoxin system TumE family protein [Rhizobium binxianense]